MRGSIHGVAAALAIVWAGALAGCQEDGLKGAEANVRETTVQLDLPPVPTFEMPEASADGTLSVRELRVKGRKRFKSELKVRGYVTWIYDCTTELHKPELTEKQVLKMIEEDPSRCNRPHFFLGASADTPPDKSIWVVEVPRELRKDEKRSMTREDLARLPPVPKFKLGDEVVVKGVWDETSPKGFVNSDGLLVYAELENLSQQAAASEE